MKHRHIDNPRFLMLMVAMAEASGKITTEVKNSIYANAFEDIEISDLENAVWKLLKSRVFSSFPQIGEVIEFVGGKVDDRAELEAAKVWQAIRHVGGWKSVVFDDATTQAVIQYTFGGWSKLCGEMLEDQQKWFIKDFVKAYGAYSRQKITVNGVLPGRGEVGEPMLIGDHQKALQIMHTKQENRIAITEIYKPKMIEYEVSDGEAEADALY